MNPFPHTIPGVGLRDVTLRWPADEVYGLLVGAGEVDRLRNLRHLGAIGEAFPGATHSRWDYAANSLFVAYILTGRGLGTEAKLGLDRKFSVVAACQTLLLMLATGHLPGTFGTEKGVAQWLHEAHGGDCVAGLPAPLAPNVAASWASNGDHLKTYLKGADYRRVSRVLAIVRMADVAHGAGSADVATLVEHLLVPYVLRKRRNATQRRFWDRVDLVIDHCRRLAFLNLDALVAAPTARVDVAGFISHLAATGHGTSDIDEIAGQMDVLATYEHLIYDRVYHLREARGENARVAEAVRAVLLASGTPATDIRSWLGRHSVDQVLGGPLPQATSPHHVTTVRLRSRRVELATPWSRHETNDAAIRRRRGISANVLAYRPWRRSTTGAVPELIVDFRSDANPSGSDLGNVLLWVMDELDTDVGAPKQNLDRVLHSADLNGVYQRVIQDMMGAAWGAPVDLRLVPWPLTALGRLGPGARDPVAWKADLRLDDKATKAVLYRGFGALPAYLRGDRDEVIGLAAVRDHVRDECGLATTKRRIRHLLLTASIQVASRSTGRVIAEFDGGILQIKSRSGDVVAYLAETKGGRTWRHARTKLDAKLTRLRDEGLNVSGTPSVRARSGPNRRTAVTKVTLH